MSQREHLLSLLEAYYHDCGWRVSRKEDGLLAAEGPGGVTWHGLAVADEDLADPDTLRERLRELAQRRMAGGELCPLDLLPADAARPDLAEVLRRARLAHRPHVSVYTSTAGAVS